MRISSRAYPMFADSGRLGAPESDGVRWGLDLPMSVGAVAMSLSTIIVAANAQLLRHVKLQHEPLQPYAT